MCIMRGPQSPAVPAATHRSVRPGEPALGAGPCGVPDGGPVMPFASLLDPGRPGLMQACLSAALRRARQAERAPSDDAASARVVEFKRRPV